MSVRWWVAAALTMGLMTAATADAQACAGGRVATAEGYCCWPGQRWSAEHRRCDGPPRCPSPLAAAGDECVGGSAGVMEPGPSAPDMVRAEGVVDYGSGAAGAAGGPIASPTSPSVVQPSGEIGSAWPSSGRIPPGGGVNPHVETRSIEGLQAAGLVILGLGYAAAITFSVLAFESDGLPNNVELDTTCHDGIGGSLLLPLIGGFIAWGVSENCTVPRYLRVGGVGFRLGEVRIQGASWSVLSGVASGFQLLGLALVLSGSLATADVTVFEDGGARVTIDPQGVRARFIF